jgi:hypothetical protein
MRIVCPDFLPMTLIFDLVVAGESFFEGARWCWHIVAPALHSISPIHASKQFICRKVQPVDR